MKGCRESKFPGRGDCGEIKRKIRRASLNTVGRKNPDRKIGELEIA